MSFASHTIAGITPIAGGVPDSTFYTKFWGPTAQVYVPDFDTGATPLFTVFWGPTSQVYAAVLVDPDSSLGELICVPAHLTSAVVEPHEDHAEVPGFSRVPCKRVA